MCQHYGQTTLPGVFRDPGLPDYGHLDTAGVAEIVFDFFGDLFGQIFGLVIVNHLVIDDNTKFPAGLDCEGFVHTGKTCGDAFQVFQALDVVVQSLPAGAGTGGGDGIGYLYQNGLDT